MFVFFMCFNAEYIHNNENYYVFGIKKHTKDQHQQNESQGRMPGVTQVYRKTVDRRPSALISLTTLIKIY